MTFPSASFGRLLALLSLCLCGLLLPGRAAAQSCTTTSSPTINFGSVDVLSGVDPAVMSSSITVKCTAANRTTDNFKVCLSIGGASGTTPPVGNSSPDTGTSAAPARPAGPPTATI